MEYPRKLDLSELASKKSFFLLGPRAAGKSYLARKTFGNRAVNIDLLSSDLAFRLTAAPGDLEAIIAARGPGPHTVVIDEIQRLPLLLDEVHRLIEKEGHRFVLTGSSARKLRRGGVNLLAGRAWTAELHPLTAGEIPGFDLERFLRFGGLPPVHRSDFPEEELHAYCSTYLREEIQSEGLVRKLPQFSRFLTVSALGSGAMLNFAALSRDTGVPASSIREYYSVLADTLLGFYLEPWTRSRKRRAISTAKFYLFDVGVAHTLAGTKNIDRNSDLYGRSFEHFIGMELRAFLSYERIREPLRYWRSAQGHEVDFVVGDRLAVEVKATRRVADHDLRSLRALHEEGIIEALLLVTQDRVATIRDGIRCIPWQDFLEELWSKKLPL
ncbi:MAG: ATP-binding protein [Polyangia bacterium]|jgi:predicted AAA+ superfamily ATPase|nr:ATP-binding protein [Polyangia bacterium]